MNQQPRLTAIVITQDRTKAEEAINSLQFADELIVEEHSHIDNFSSVRNQALRRAKHEWVLFVDDDELVSSELAKEILRAIKNPKINGYFLYRRDLFLDRVLKHGENGSLKFLRLARKSAGTFNRPVHEIWYIKGRLATLKHPLLHYPHHSIASFLTKINHYSTLDAEYRFHKGKSSNLFKISFYPFFKFIHNYFFRLGILDGTPGLIMAIMMSFHSFQTWTKLYLLQHRHENNQ